MTNRLVTTRGDLLWLLLYIGGTWACAAVVRYFPNGVQL